MNHYERLGVEPDAPTSEIRAAYLRAARRVHPDAAGNGPGRSAEMAEINEAWTQLSDPDRRRRHDLAAGLVNEPPVAPRVVRSSEGPAFRPLDDSDVDDSFRYSDDEGDPATATGGFLTMVPLALVAIAVGAGILGIVLDSGGLLRIALISLVACLVSLVAIPVVVMGRAVRHEGRPHSP